MASRVKFRNGYGKLIGLQSHLVFGYFLIPLCMLLAKAKGNPLILYLQITKIQIVNIYHSI
jgi:hypothetical protein